MLIINVILFGPIGITMWAVQMLWAPIFAAGIINGVGHYWGYRNFQAEDASRNIVPWGILIGGEELHNNHHAYATSARLSNKWYEFDIGWMYIRILEMMGLAKVKKVAPKLRFNKEKTQFEVPSDPIFRTYRFIYTPSTGKGEVFVNSVVVWSHQGQSNMPLLWKDSENIIIGKSMNGGGIDRPVFDNLVIRSTGTVSMFSESLLNFMLEPKDQQVKINWSTTMNEQVDYFTIERSINGLDFVKISTFPSNPNLSEGEDYSYTDHVTDVSNVVYYRLRQTFLSGKFVTHPLSAVRFKTDKGLSIETVKPVPFQQSFDVSYFLPHSGRVWIQLSDAKGTILSTKTFEAPQGKNVHIFRDQDNLASGEYSLDVIFENKKVSRKITKG